MHGNRSYASRNGTGVLRQEKKGRCMKGKVRGKTIMRARAAVLQFWISSFPNKILFICINFRIIDVIKKTPNFTLLGVKLGVNLVNH